MLFVRSVEKKYMIGFDIDDDTAQMSYSMQAAEPETFSLSGDGEEMDIPAALCKKKGENIWYFGSEAIHAAAEEGGELVLNLLDNSLYETQIMVDGETYEPWALLSLFVSKCLALLFEKIPKTQVGAMMFTSRRMDPEMVGILEKVQERLLLPFPVFFEPHEDSFYHYMLMQDDAFRRNGVLLCEMDKNDRMNVSRLMFNNRTEPIVAYIEKGAYSSLSGDDTARDMEFLDILQRELAMRHLDAAYLIGDGFKGGWMKSSVTYLLRGRRVFQGNNLFSKGAAYGALFKCASHDITAKYFFLGETRLKMNIGIYALNKESEKYISLLDAGTNWYEAESETDIILENGNEIIIAMIPLQGGDRMDYRIRLDELPVRDDRLTRIRIRLTMPAKDRLLAEITDLGFGDIFASTRLRWRKEITL
ncbi:MAG: hypothetical protein J6P87_03125 [Lachnospiraceae bacterium]|nr:hypothetical protein [Lachnospiraceae bacterium]